MWIPNVLSQTGNVDVKQETVKKWICEWNNFWRHSSWQGGQGNNGNGDSGTLGWEEGAFSLPWSTPAHQTHTYMYDSHHLHLNTQHSKITNPVFYSKVMMKLHHIFSSSNWYPDRPRSQTQIAFCCLSQFQWVNLLEPQAKSIINRCESLWNINSVQKSTTISPSPSHL